MASQSSRANSAAEARYRIDAPNALPRRVVVIALGDVGETLVRKLAGKPWATARFLIARQTAVTDLDFRSVSVFDAIDGADHVMLIVAAGADAALAPLVGEICGARQMTVSAFVLAPIVMNDAELSRTLADLRPVTKMLVISSDAEYIADVLTSLRA